MLFTFSMPFNGNIIWVGWIKKQNGPHPAPGPLFARACSTHTEQGCLKKMNMLNTNLNTQCFYIKWTVFYRPMRRQRIKEAAAQTTSQDQDGFLSLFLALYSISPCCFYPIPFLLFFQLHFPPQFHLSLVHFPASIPSFVLLLKGFLSGWEGESGWLEKWGF